MTQKRLLNFVCGVIISQACLGQDTLNRPTPSEQVLAKMGTYHINYPQEKIYLHFDKPHYVLGERIWFKAYLLNAILHNTITPSQQVYVELIDPRNRILVTELIPIKNGGGSGDFLLEPTMTPGDYLIRAYTNYQRNFKNSFFYEKEIRVYNAYSSIANTQLDETDTDVLDLRSSSLSQESDFLENNIFFFPEGGELVAGLPSKVAVNAFDKNFDGVKVRGEIHSEGGQIVTRFVTAERGLGFFSFIPEPKKKYFAVVEWEDREVVHPLPEIEDSGYGITVINKNDTLSVRINSTPDVSLRNAFLVTHIRGQLHTLVEGLNGREMQLKIPLLDAPTGVIHLTLFNGEGIPLLERLVYHHKEDMISGKLESKSEIENRRKFKISIGSDASSIVNGSISITSHPFASPSEWSSTLGTYLLLESDLRGRINDPAYYLSEEGRRTGQLDLLMITHGWKRFEWRNLLKDPHVDLELIPENGISLRGHTTKYGYLWKPQKSRVFVSTLDQFGMFEQTTDDEGYFEIDGLGAYDSIPLLIQAEKLNPKKESKLAEDSDEIQGPSGSRFVNIYLDIPDPPFIDRAFAHFDPEPEKSILEEYFTNSKKTYIVDSIYKSMPVFQLEEVVIESRKVQEDIPANVLYKQPDKRLILDSAVIGKTSRNVFEIIKGRYPGVNVIGEFPKYEVTMRAVGSTHDNTPAIYVLDGKIVEADVLNVLPVFRIEFIDILSSLSKSAVYGSRGSGVVAVYTKEKRKASKYFAIGSMNHTLPGYYLAKTFSSPDYGRSGRSSNRPDFRTTLYWDPEIILSPGKTQDLEFFTGDLSGDFQIRFEGVSMDGNPVVLRRMFKVK